MHKITEQEAIEKYRKARTKRQKEDIVFTVAFQWGMFKDEVEDFLRREVNGRR